MFVDIVDIGPRQQLANNSIMGSKEVQGEGALQASDPINLIFHASSRMLGLVGNSLLRSNSCGCRWLLIPRLLLSLIPTCYSTSFYPSDYLRRVTCRQVSIGATG